MSDAVFTRKDTPEGVVFEVTPAPQSAGYTFKWAALAGALLVPALMMASASFVFPVIGLIVAGLCCLPIRNDMAKRKAAMLIVGRNELSVNGTPYPAQGIAELYLKEPQSAGRVVYGNGLQVAGSEIGAAIDRSHNRRCLSLVLRMRDNSRPTEIIFGLTPEAGMALLNDIGFALGLSKTS